MLVSIIIPTYNQSNLIHKAIVSAQAQTYNAIEIIIADDGSIDETNKIVAKFKDSRTFYHKNEINLGRVKNYNNALKNLSKGDYVCVLDGDDYFIDNNFIQNAVAEIKKNNDVLFYQGKCKSVFNVGLNNLINENIIEIKQNINATEYLTGFNYYGFAHLCTLYSRDKAIETGFYLKDISSSDIESFMRMCLKFPQSTILITNKIVAAWVKHGANTSSNLTFKEIKASSWDVYKETVNSFQGKKIGLGNLWLFKQSFKPIVLFFLQKLGLK